MFDLMILENTTKQVEFYKSCKCACKINSSVCSEKQRFNENKCRHECLINKKAKMTLFGTRITVSVNTKRQLN